MDQDALDQPGDKQEANEHIAKRLRTQTICATIVEAKGKLSKLWVPRHDQNRMQHLRPVIIDRKVHSATMLMILSRKEEQESFSSYSRV